MPTLQCGTIYNSQDMEATSTFINRGIKKMWYKYTTKHNSVIKRTKILPFAAT